MPVTKPLGHLFDVVPAIVPLDLQTARDGDWVSLKNAAGVAVVVLKGAGTDGDDPVVSFEQATDVSGAGAKALSTITTVYEKEGTLTAVGTWAKATQAAGASYSPGDPSAQSQGLYVFQVDAAELDVDGGFDCLRVRVADTGTNAQLGAALYILYGLSYPSAPESLPSAIAD
jgi:hypothetical protein